MSGYRAAPDRVGWALALGGASVGTAAALVGWASETGDPLRLAVLWAIGAAVGVVAIAGLGGPAWWLVQRSARRGPVAAGATGAAVAGLATLLMLTQGLGAGLPASDGATAAAIWTSAVATAAVAAFPGGLLGLAMWLVGYRSS